MNTPPRHIHFCISEVVVLVIGIVLLKHSERKGIVFR